MPSGILYDVRRIEYPSRAAAIGTEPPIVPPSPDDPCVIHLRQREGKVRPAAPESVQIGMTVAEATRFGIRNDSRIEIRHADQWDEP